MHSFTFMAALALSIGDGPRLLASVSLTRINSRVRKPCLYGKGFVAFQAAPPWLIAGWLTGSAPELFPAMFYLKSRL